MRRNKTPGAIWSCTVLAHLIVSLGITALYLTLMGDFAIRRATVPQVDNGFITTVAGGPPTINRMRLFMAGLMGCMAAVCGERRLTRRTAAGWLAARAGGSAAPPGSSTRIAGLVPFLHHARVPPLPPP